MGSCRARSVYLTTRLLGTDIMIWYGIANGQISLIFDRGICAPHDSGGLLSFHVFISMLHILYVKNILSGFGWWT